MWGYDSEEDEELDENEYYGWLESKRRRRRSVPHQKNQSGTKLLELKDLRVICAESGLPAKGTKVQLLEVLKMAKNSGVHIQAGVPSPMAYEAFFGTPLRDVPLPTRHTAPDVYEFNEDTVHEENALRGYPEGIEVDTKRLKMALANETLFALQGQLADTLTPMIHMKSKKKQLSYPVSKFDFDTLWKDAKEAPVGKGTQTVYDAQERNCRYYAPSDFEIKSQIWNTYFSNSKQSVLLEKLRTELAPNTSLIEARLYKMVLYNEKSFFKSHLDTQRAEDMFGTLVVEISAMAKSWGGGVLSVYHTSTNGKKRMVQMKRASKQFMAFYADCVHSVESLWHDDFRVMLIYNLHRVGEPVNIPKVSEKDRYIDAFKTITQKHKDFIFGHLLEHQYGAVSVVPRHLKGNDATLFQALDESPDFDILLCPIQVEITASAFSGDEEGMWQTALDMEKNPEVILTATFPIDPLAPAKAGFGVLSDEALENSRVIMLERSAAKWSAMAHASVTVTGNEGSSAALIYVHGALFVKYKDATKIGVQGPTERRPTPIATKATLTSHAKKTGEIYPTIAESAAKQTAVNIPLLGATKSVGISDSLQQLRTSLIPQLELYQTSLNTQQTLLADYPAGSDFETFLQVLKEREFITSDLKSLKATLTSMKKFSEHGPIGQQAPAAPAPVAKPVTVYSLSSPRPKNTVIIVPTHPKSPVSAAKSSVAATPTKALPAASPPKVVHTIVDLTDSVGKTTAAKRTTPAAATSPKSTASPKNTHATAAKATTATPTKKSTVKATATPTKKTTAKATPGKATPAKATAKATPAKATAKATATSPPASPPAKTPKRTAKATKVTSPVATSPKATKASKVTSPVTAKATASAKSSASKKRPASKDADSDPDLVPTPKKRAKRS